MRDEQINLKVSSEERGLLRKAAKRFQTETGQKPNVSKAIRAAVKEYGEKEVFYFDVILYKNICDFYTLTLKYFQGIATDFNLLKFGNISESNFEQILSANFADLEKRYFISIEENLEKLQLSNEFVEQNLRSGTEVPWNIFKSNTEKNLKNIEYNKSRPLWTHLPLTISIYSLIDGIITFSNDDKERVKEKYCLTFIESEPQRQFLKLTLETLERLKKLQGILLKNGFYDLWGYNGLFDIEADTEEIIFYKESLKYITKI